VKANGRPSERSQAQSCSQNERQKARQPDEIIVRGTEHKFGELLRVEAERPRANFATEHRKRLTQHDLASADAYFGRASVTEAEPSHCSTQRAQRGEEAQDLNAAPETTCASTLNFTTHRRWLCGFFCCVAGLTQAGTTLARLRAISARAGCSFGHAPREFNTGPGASGESSGSG
jgi:hypothetical protein